MLCTKLLSPIDELDNFSIIPMVDIGDFVLYKRISNKKFFNSISLADYLKKEDEKLQDTYIEPGEFFITSNKLFKEEYNKEDEIIKSIINSSYFSQIKLKELKNLIQIINKDGLGGSLITLNKNIDNTFEPYFVFVDPYIAEKELNYLLNTPLIKGNLGAIANLYENMIINLKKANESFLDKNSHTHFFVHNVLITNIEKVIFDIENSN
ncbi:hypothetical protein DMC14_000280 [Metamycoplasma phocicerebrale]|uniref:Uncharacterized protein n=1 Tax=Metamycoplasma phocicerebrale TaxID=142649 RepID=A0A3T0TT42_9BACT|nr:hypothetical protein [Metamycoplasma phocicerebrale]AZZ65247.1 hypothetical protein DMC14_000280 [Metamycoplasma phocicerebrale]